MSLEKCGLNIGNGKKELKPHGTIDFPCAGYRGIYSLEKNQDVPWHWHEEIEIIYVESGTLNVRIPGLLTVLTEGQCIIINSSILHNAIPNPSCKTLSFVFHPLLVMGNKDSVFARKYMSPLLSCSSFRSVLYTTEKNIDVINSVLEAFKALENDIFGFEFIVREKLSFVCYCLFKDFEKEIKKDTVNLRPDDIRIQKMIDFIHEHYQESLILEQISDSAHIGTREALRCFRRSIQTSPIQYLMEYRIRKGANLLLNEPNKGIAEIAILCGFDSPSNFSKLFKRFFCCSPRDYKEKNGKDIIHRS